MCIQIEDNGYFKVREASLFISIFSILYCLWKVCYYTYMLILNQESYDKAEYTLKKIQVIRFLILVMYIIFLIVSILLIYGWKTHKKLCMIPWMIVITVFIIIEIISPIYALVKKNVSHAIANIPDPIIAGIFFICIYTEYKAIENAGENTPTVKELESQISKEKSKTEVEEEKSEPQLPDEIKETEITDETKNSSD